METVELFGIPFARITEAECAARVGEAAAAGRGGRVVTPNVDILRQCARDPSVHAMVREADLIVADGMPLIWASRLQGTPLPERVCGSNLISSMSAQAAQRGLRLFLLGGVDDTSARTAELLRARHPELDIGGCYGPPFGFDEDEAQLADIERMIADAAPNIVFVALPFLKGERVMARIRRAAPNAWWCGIGVTFSFVAGDVRRAPRWMQDAGLEWFHRFTQEPGRLARRYFVDDIPFALELLARSSSSRVRRRVGI